MIDRDQFVGEDELNAYVDGELPAERRSAVEAWLATHPDDAAKVAAWRKQAELIRARYGAVADEMPPQRFNVAPVDAPALRRDGGGRRRGRRGLPRRRRRRLGARGVEARDARPIWRALPPTRSMPTGSTSSRSATRSRCRATSGRIWCNGCRSGSARRCARPNSTRWD